MNLSPWLSFAHEAMATTFGIAIARRPPEYSRQAAAAAFRELDRLEAELSRHVESSDIARANRLAPGEAIAIGDDALACLLVAVKISAATGRAFDPAYGSERPADATAALFALDPAAHALTSLAPRLQLDLGAVGKGYALDRLAEVLRDWDVTSACLHSGGSTVLAFGAPDGHAGWPVTVAGEARALLDRAVSGSGLAVRGAHIRDPRTLRPALRSAGVWSYAATAAEADALSTAFFVMTDEEIADFCRAHPEYDAVLASPSRA
jgi:thiamine biosynthesis lipoprotein